jgi:broad specificity phosphatase PhoE
MAGAAARMKKLYFVRHGQSVMNVSGHVSGHTDTELTDEGREQAKVAGQSAKNLQIDYIISSPLKRAHETAKIIAREIGYPEASIHLNSLFMERYYGKAEGEVWRADLDVDGFADVETVDEIMGRAKQALKFLHSLEAERILVVSHGAFGRALRSVIREEDYSRDDRLENASLHHWYGQEN